MSQSIKVIFNDYNPYIGRCHLVQGLILLCLVLRRFKTISCRGVSCHFKSKQVVVPMYTPQFLNQTLQLDITILDWIKFRNSKSKFPKMKMDLISIG